jgi:hypothetical protein
MAPPSRAERQWLSQSAAVLAFCLHCIGMTTAQVITTAMACEDSRSSNSKRYPNCKARRNSKSSKVILFFGGYSQAARQPPLVSLSEGDIVHGSHLDNESDRIDKRLSARQDVFQRRLSIWAMGLLSAAAGLLVFLGATRFDNGDPQLSFLGVVSEQ